MDQNIKIGQLIHRTCSIVDAYVNSQVSNKENGHLTAIEGRTLAFIVNQKQVVTAQDRSEERRVGKECRSRWSPYH